MYIDSRELLGRLRLCNELLDYIDTLEKSSFITFSQAIEIKAWTIKKAKEKGVE